MGVPKIMVTPNYHIVSIHRPFCNIPIYGKPYHGIKVLQCPQVQLWYAFQLGGRGNLPPVSLQSTSMGTRANVQDKAASKAASRAAK